MKDSFEAGVILMNNKLMKMIGKRLLQSVIAIIIVTMFVFFLSHLVPGGPRFKLSRCKCFDRTDRALYSALRS